MAVSLVPGQRSWSMSRDAEGHRNYTLKSLVKCDKLEGPASAIQCPGLPIPGSLWLVDYDIDIWAFCTQETNVTPLVTNEPNEYFEVENKFTTKPNPSGRGTIPNSSGGSGQGAPNGNASRCADAQFDDPLLELPKINIKTVRYQEEVTKDYLGNPIKTSSHEQIRGANVEFDLHRFLVTFSANFPTLGSDVWGTLINHVNDEELWGFPARCVKLSDVDVTPQYYGQCYIYYNRKYEFEIFVKVDPDTGEMVSGFDRDILDEGTKVLNGRWGRGGNEGHGWIVQNINGTKVPDPNNPADFIRFKDRNNEYSRVILNGRGVPYDADGETSGTADDQPGYINVKYYPTGNLLLLGIPLGIG